MQASSLSVADAAEGLELKFNVEDIIKVPNGIPTGPISLRIPRSRIVRDDVSIEGAASVAADDIVVARGSSVTIEATVGGSTVSSSGTVALVDGTLQASGRPAEPVRSLLVPSGSAYSTEAEATEVAGPYDTVVSAPVVRAGSQVRAYLVFRREGNQ